jgi:hypothetical protein
MMLEDDALYEFAKVGATDSELADYFGCSEAELRENHARTLAKARADGRMSLRKLLWASAEKGTATIQIFLAKLLCPPDSEVLPPLVDPDEQTQMLEDDETLEHVCGRDERWAASRTQSGGVRASGERRAMGVSQASGTPESQTG